MSEASFAVHPSASDGSSERSEGPLAGGRWVVPSRRDRETARQVPFGTVEPMQPAGIVREST